MVKNPDNRQNDFIIRQFQDDNPHINAHQELEKFAAENNHIKLYLDCIKKTEENRKKHVRETQTYTDIIDEVLNSKPFLSFKRRKELTQIELTKLAEKLLEEKDQAKLESLLKVFTHHKFPFDSEFILKLAKQKATSKNRITEYAIDCLTFLKSDAIRQFALERITKAKRPASFIEILTSNYRKGDQNLLIEIASKAKSEHIIESLSASYIDIFKANKTKECKEPLEVLYNKMNCGIHRKGIVEVLIENGVLSDRLIEEINYDSYLETRQLLNRKKRPPKS